MEKTICGNYGNKLYKSNAKELFPIENIQQPTIKRNTSNNFRPNTNTISATNISSLHTIERQIEQSLQQYGIFYCKPDQLIGFGNLKQSPLFVIPSNKLAIFENKHSIEKYFSLMKGWKAVVADLKAILSEIELSNTRLREIGNENKAKNRKFTFVDLYAGIGGFRIPLEKLGGHCLGFSEIDKNAIETYKLNYFGLHNSEEIELGSVTNLNKLPFEDIDLIVGGVPCQSWSVAGKMKGFEDPRGQLWNDTVRIVELNKPKTFIFENVKGLYDPRNKESLEFIINCFENIGYTVKTSLLNSYDFGLPQNRERIYLVGIRNDLATIEYQFPLPQNKESFLYNIIDNFNTPITTNQKEEIESSILFGEKIPMSRNRFQKLNELNDFFVFCDTRNGHTTIHSWDLIETTEREKFICLTILRNRRKQKYGNDDGNPLSFNDLAELIPSLQLEELVALMKKKILRVVEGKGYAFVNSKNSSGINNLYRIYLPSSNIFPTITATGTKDALALKNVSGKTPDEYKKNFIKEIIEPGLYRPLSVREAGKLQGFPEDFAFHKDERIAKKQFGNAVSTNVVHYVAESLLRLSIYNKND